MGQEITDLIQKRTRAGQGVTPTGTSYGLKPLASSYVKQRESLARKGRLSSYTTPGTSNLTQTGKMVDDITWVAAEGKLTIRFSTASSSQKAAYVSDQRPFFNLTRPELNDIVNNLTKEILNNIKSVT